MYLIILVVYLQEKSVEVSEILKSGSVDGVMGFLAVYQSKMSHLDEQSQLYDREKKALSDLIQVLRVKAFNLNPTTVKEAKVNKCVIEFILCVYIMCVCVVCVFVCWCMWCVHVILLL